MIKNNLLLGILICFLPLVGCTDSFDASIVHSNYETPAIMKEIYFDGAYVQTDHSTWPIAFNSFAIETNNLIINGSFIIPSSTIFDNKESLENSFNNSEYTAPYIISYGSSKNGSYSNLDNTKWFFTDINSNNHCSFVLKIDIKPLMENNDSLGDLIVGGVFNVFHGFNGGLS